MFELPIPISEYKKIVISAIPLIKDLGFIIYSYFETKILFEPDLYRNLCQLGRVYQCCGTNHKNPDDRCYCSSDHEWDDTETFLKTLTSPIFKETIEKYKINDICEFFDILTKDREKLHQKFLPYYEKLDIINTDIIMTIDIKSLTDDLKTIIINIIGKNNG